MPTMEERERLFQKVISRWENEGGAVAPRDRSHPRAADHQNTIRNPTPYSDRWPRVNSNHTEQAEKPHAADAPGKAT